MLDFVSPKDSLFKFQNTQIFWIRMLGFHSDDPAMNCKALFGAKAKNLLWFFVQLY